MMSRNDAQKRLNHLGKEGIPFHFYCDFLGENWCIESSENSNFTLEINHEKPQQSNAVDEIKLTKRPIPFECFNEAFQQVTKHIKLGNSFLTNLTFQTPIETDLSLAEIYQHTGARYKLHVLNQFVVFSPETFVKTHNNRIYSLPMKGTIDAKLPDAATTILNDPKELAEHITIVDLIRNDLSLVANHVNVSRFRYIEEIKTRTNNLLQVSSEIVGDLQENWKHSLGDILLKLLPAGSISGAPKPKTIDIIKQSENYNRGYYTGICGHFNGVDLDSGVMIRFIKQGNDQLYYCSGGGITSFSNPQKEYQEMIDKIYLPAL